MIASLSSQHTLWEGKPTFPAYILGSLIDFLLRILKGEARLAAKRAARAEAREIRMKELEKQQKEEDNERYSHKSRRNASASDEDEHISVYSRGSFRPSEYSCYLGSESRASSRTSSARASPVVEERSEKDFEKGIRTASSLSAATLASLGGTFSRRGSGDTSVSIDTEASIREIKDINELKDQIQNVEGKYMQGLKEMKDSLAEVEEKYKKAMVSNAQLDNEKTNFMYQVDTLQDALLELEEQLAESKRQFEEKSKDFEREKHARAILQFQFMEVKEALKQREELLAEIRQLQQKQEGFVREITDLQETIEWKEKKIGALERQKVFFDSLRSERDDLREEVVLLKEQLKQYGIIPNLGVATNGEISDCLANDGLSNSSKIVSETSHASKVSEDCTVGKANEVEMENEILENMGKREILQNTEHEENTEDTKDQEITLKCLEIKTLPTDENIETEKIPEAKVTSTLKLNSGPEDPIKSYSECIPEIVYSPQKRNAVELIGEEASPSHITEEKVSNRNVNITHNQNNVADPGIEINQEIHADLEILPQQQSKEKQIDIVVDEAEGNTEVFWEALDFVNNGQMAISTSPELVEVILTKASSIDLNNEQSKNGVVEGNLNQEFLTNDQNATITTETEGPKMEMCGINEENEAQNMVQQQEDQVIDSAEEQPGTPSIMKFTLDEFGEEQVKIEEIQSPSSEHDAVVEEQNEQEIRAKKDNIEDIEVIHQREVPLKALDAHLDSEKKNGEHTMKDIDTEQAVVNDINQSECQAHEGMNANIENDSSRKIKSDCIDGALADIHMLHEKVADDNHIVDSSAGKQSVDEEDKTIKESAVTTAIMKEDTEEVCTGNEEGKNCRKLQEEVHSVVPDIEEVACLKSQKTEFIEQKEPESEEVVVEEYHEALDFDESSFAESKTSERRDSQTNKNNEKVKANLISAEEVGSEALVDESDSIQQLKGHKFEEAKSVQIDSTVFETTKSQCEPLEDTNKLLDEISSKQIADYASEQLENLESVMNENQEETQMYKKGKGKSREDCIIS
ncbi:leucine-rich repeat flightless-interacting protein 1 isoform X3 [Python bivittatus]|uniref:Leucine-rich repeat flightless-interacting protein 1 isoform X3 n=1 Tax=Python bivittatus TaxID=176946 RepID=A0A9F5MYC5_PYTBI|nr:leucine-rich repeat flightless-interacting protein 1 isoform X3 [Python bivittatus]